MKTYNFKYGHGSVSLSLNEADILAELHGTCLLYTSPSPRDS